MKNIGSVDRVIRVILGIALVAAGIAFSGQGLWWIALIAVLPFSTALVRVCPAYLPFGINTAKKG